jgi:2-C-methyl-D-erythritol 2,4-cyclodiphosphate synthase
VGAPLVRVGLGIDRHPFSPDRPLVLAGVTLPGGPGLAGHSDADAVLHAVADALAGAVGLPDIGTRFPGGDPRWRGAPSRRFAEAVIADVQRDGWEIGNLDVVLLAEVPPLQPHLETMRRSLASILGVTPDRVGLKAKRGETLGFVGKREGIEVHAVALVTRASRRAPAAARAKRNVRRAARRRR